MPPPSSAALSAFGLSGTPQPVDGGGGLCFLLNAQENVHSGLFPAAVILRPSEDVEEAQYIAQLTTLLLQQYSLPSAAPYQPFYRLSKPLTLIKDRSSYVYVENEVHDDHKRQNAAWTAWTHLPGSAGPQTLSEWKQLLVACRAFHVDLAEVSKAQKKSLPPTSFLSDPAKTNRWRQADLVAFDELPFTREAIPGLNADMLAYFQPLLKRLTVLKRNLDIRIVSQKTQWIHGDMTGNVLFDRTKSQEDAEDKNLTAPGIIDLTLYRRPAAYAEAVVVADGLAWHGQGLELVEMYLNTSLDQATRPQCINSNEGIIRVPALEMTKSKQARDAETEFKLQLLIRALSWRMITFIIDSDLEWIKTYLPASNHEHAVSVIETVTREQE